MLVKVYAVNTKATQRFLRSLGNVFRISDNGLASRFHVEAELGGDEDLIPLPGPFEPESARCADVHGNTGSRLVDSPLADEVLTIEVHIGCIPVGATELVHSIQELIGLR